MNVNFEMDQRKFELESQLHNQYAENFNSHVGAFVSILGIIFVVFTALGYVYAHTDVTSWNLFTDSEVYSLHHYFVMSILVSGILFFLSYLCSMFSYIERRDQIINRKIRDEYKVETGYENPNEVEMSEFMPEFYKAFFRMLIVAQLLVIGMSSVRIICNIVSVENGTWTWWGILPICSFLLSFGLIWLSSYSKQMYYKKLNLKDNDNLKDAQKRILAFLKYYF